MVGYPRGWDACLPIVLLVALAQAVVPSPAAGQAPEVKTLIEQAEKDARARKYEAAVAGYRQAFDLSRDPLYLYNVSVLYLSRLDKPLLAWEYAVRFSEAAKTDEDRRDAVEWLSKVEESLSRTHGKFEVEASPRDAVLWLDGRDEAARLVRPVAWVLPGPHRVYGEAAEHEPGEVSADATAGGTARVTLGLMPRFARLEVECAVPGCAVFVDGPRLGDAPGIYKVQPGPHVVRVEAPLFLALEQPLTFRAGETRKLRADLKPKPVEPPREVVKAAPLPRPRHLWSWVSIGTGMAAAATGTVLYFLARRELTTASGMGLPKSLDDDAFYDDFDGHVSRGRALGYSAYALWGLGAAALGTGIYLYFREDRTSGLSLVPAGPDGPGAAVSIRW